MKFGGSSLADYQSIKTAAEIILLQKESIAVVSAPGKRVETDLKVTDLLFNVYKCKQENKCWGDAFRIIEDRFTKLFKDIGNFDLQPQLKKIKDDINDGASMDYILSRGEYLSALLISSFLNYEFIDAINLIQFDSFGKLDKTKSFLKIKKKLKNKQNVIIPGFYGAMPDGSIKTFSRGGSDITGAVIAAALKAEEYQNWTDVDGFYFCPLMYCCRPIKNLSYDDAHLLAYMGSVVLHHDCLPICKDSSIPIRIKNTFNPFSEGSLICDNVKQETNRPIGLSGRAGFYLIKYDNLRITLKEIISKAEDNGATILLGFNTMNHGILISDSKNTPQNLNIKAIEIKPIALIAIIGDIRLIFKTISDIDLKHSLIYSNTNCVFVGTEESQLKNTMHLLCTAFNF